MTTTGIPTTGGPAAGPRPEPRYAWIRRGRHRRPRPRKVVLAAGGLALAAGALSLVRLLPEPGGDVGGGHGALAAPRVEGGGRDTAAQDPESAAAASGTGRGSPEAGPSATSVMGGLGGSPGPGLVPGLAPGPSASGAPLPPAATSAPGAPDTAGGRPADRQERGEREGGSDGRTRAPGTPSPSGSDRPAPRPTPTPPPDRGTPPAPDPVPEPDDPGLCVPVIGLCVDLLGG
ncbi:hypothetical protein EV562_1059 [Streptomyces sp. BK208]|uniref:hypothetical protein n=1 Tax=Streptomyces sp. BK208 TaxID=2512150 RepID=UPI0010DF6C46|nr:hypothetical protein [Streptomyces sp. BK208]TDT37995.1 hypothetical protein EV562_1059 [Streptomyces sp. BK208]